MKLTTLTAALAVTLTFAHTAQAREHQHHRYLAYHRHAVYHQASRHVLAHRYAAQGEQDYRKTWDDAGETSAWAGQSTWGGQSTTWGGRRSAKAAFAWSAQATYQGSHGGGGFGARPRAWCGWEMRHLVGSDPGPEYNLARNWARWGRAGPPGIGAVVVWAHHVGKIVGEENGHWIVESGNDGNRLRIRPLSIARAIAIRWG